MAPKRSGRQQATAGADTASPAGRKGRNGGVDTTPTLASTASTSTNAGADTGRKHAPHSHSHSRRTPWLWLVPVFTLLPFLLSKLHYHLPAPQPPYDANGAPQPAEEVVLRHIKALEDIGYRTVGTQEAEAGERYVEAQVRALVNKCDEGDVLKCEVWVQRGSGYHMFGLAGHDVLKLYSGVSNIILKISAHNPPSGPPAGHKDSILLGAHIDSTMPSPGAADDGMGVGVMLDIARVLIERNKPFDNSIIFMWNGAEETLQDGSHLYSTQHETRDSVHAVINLEAAGTTGGALLFQATSREMIEAFRHAPHPRGTVIAADVFTSGIMISDTDFVQFEQYLGVSGLDMAIVGHSYFYHTRGDILANIQVGSAQHFTTNVMAIVDFLLSPESPLHSDAPWSPPDMVYMSLYDRFFATWTMASADIAYVALATLAATLAVWNFRRDRARAFLVAVLGSPVSLIAGLAVSLGTAAFMVAIGKTMAWFPHEALPIPLYGTTGILGHLGTQYALASLVDPTHHAYLENAQYYAQLLVLTAYMLGLQALRIRSAYLFAGLLCVCLVGALSTEVRRLISGRSGIPFFAAYIVPLVLLHALAMEAFTTTLDIFVPLTGRMGKEAPVEFIIATITSLCTLTFFPLLSPLFARASRPGQRRVLVALVVVLAGVVGLFVSPAWSPYDAMHPKRMTMQYQYNHTSGAHTAYFAFADLAGNEQFAHEFHAAHGGDSELRQTVLGDYSAEWDSLYPVSTFLDTYEFPLEPVAFDWPEMSITSDRKLLADGTTRIHIKTDHKGLVWPALGFEADIVDWSFEFPPPKGFKRHHIKAATSVDEHEMELELVVRLKEDEKLALDWVAFDLNQMVPGTASRLGPDMPASKWLMAIDDWAHKRYNGAFDILMSGSVCGRVEI